MCPASEIDSRTAAFRNMLQGDPANQLAWFSLGKICFELGDHSEAEKALQRLLELNPEHSQGHRILGESLFALARREEAREILFRGIEIAHRRGEFLPRNQMQEALLREGFVPPRPERNAAAAPLPVRTAPAGAPPPKPGEFGCRRCGSGGPQIDFPPYPGELGQRLRQTICDSCWQEWKTMSVKVINEYRLSLIDPEAQKTLRNYMKEFLGLD